MTTFDDREQAFEAKFVHDAELRFKAEARCNRLLGIWAADLLGHKGRDAEAYAATVIAADLEESGHADVIRKIAADLGHRASPEVIEAKRNEMMTLAQAQLLEEA